MKSRHILKATLVLTASALLAGAQMSSPVRPQYDRVQGQVQNVRRSAVPGANPRQLAAGVSSMAGGFQGFYPMLGSFTPGDYGANQQLVRDALSALAMVEAVAGADPQLRSALAGAYGSLGDYQARPEFQRHGYSPVASYGRASGLMRGLVLSGNSDRSSERDLERYAMSMATWNAMNGNIWAGLNNRNQERAGEQNEANVPPPPERQAMAVPDVDTASLNEQERAAWDDLRPRFVAVSSRIAQALSNLDGLSARLRAQRMGVNAADLATSYRMQGFLEDAAALIQKKNFADGKQALDRADYERKRLR